MKNPVRLETFVTEFSETIDLFICSASFEERCFTLPRALKNLEPKKSTIIFNNNEYEEIIGNALEIETLFGKRGKKIAINSNTPIASGQSINKEFEEIFKEEVGNIFLDITTFTHETLLVIIKLLFFRKDRFRNLFIGYVGANDYSVNEEELENKWLSSGISEIRSVLGYPGALSPARKYHLIILFGFESDRTKKLIDSYEFDKISIGFGNKEHSILDKFQKLNCERHKDLLKDYPDAEEFNISLINPFEAKEKILQQANKYPDYNIVIAAMNNKISTVGIALAAIAQPKIQLIYAKSINYNVNGYSKPKDECYIFKMNF